MGDRFKFRAWDEKHKDMEYVNDLYWFEENGVHDGNGGGHYANYMLMQCAGAEDKKHKLIFESDICKFEYCNYKYVGKIVFNQKTCAFEMWNNIIVGAYGEKATNTRLLCHLDNIEVIGNIYENTELLND